METLVVHPQNEAQQRAVKAILEAMQVPYDWEPEADNESLYHPEFVAKCCRLTRISRPGAIRL